MNSRRSKPVELWEIIYISGLKDWLKASGLWGCLDGMMASLHVNDVRLGTYHEYVSMWFLSWLSMLGRKIFKYFSTDLIFTQPSCSGLINFNFRSVWNYCMPQNVAIALHDKFNAMNCSLSVTWGERLLLLKTNESNKSKCINKTAKKIVFMCLRVELISICTS